MQVVAAGIADAGGEQPEGRFDSRDSQKELPEHLAQAVEWCALVAILICQ